MVPIARRLAAAGFRLLATARHGGVPPRGRPRRRRPSTRCRRAARTSSTRSGAARWRSSSTRRPGAESYPRLVPDPAHRARVPGAVLHHHRGGGRRRRGHRALMRAGRFTVRPLQEHHRRDMSDARTGGERTPLAELLRGARAAARVPRRRRLPPARRSTRLPLDALAERAGRARARERPVDAEPALAELAEHPRRGWRRRAPAERAALLRRAHALLPAPARGRRRRRRPRREPIAYRPTEQRSSAALAALRAARRSSCAASGRSGRPSWRASAWRRSRTSSITCRSATRTGARWRRCARCAPATRRRRVGEVASVRQGDRRARAAGASSRSSLRDGGAPARARLVQPGAATSARRFRPGQRLLVHGRVEPPLGGGPPRIVHPEVDAARRRRGGGRLPRASSRSTRSRRRCRSASCGGSCRARVDEHARPRAERRCRATIARRQRLLDLGARAPPRARAAARGRPRGARRRRARSRTGRSSSTSCSSSSSAWRCGGAPPSAEPGTAFPDLGPPRPARCAPRCRSR